MAMAAEPILASTLWTTQSGDTTESSAKPPRLTTGLRSLDTAVGGGLEYGSTICVSAEADSGAEDLARGLIATHLLSQEGASVTVVDGTLSFDVKKLHRHLTFACESNWAAEDANAKALTILDRVRIMKVFDFIGLTESVTELREDLAGTGTSLTTETTPLQPRNTTAPKGTIGDSEDEDEDADDMLDNAPSPIREVVARATQPSTAEIRERNSAPRLLVIDNIGLLASPILKDNHVQGQALLVSCMRSLSHLTKTHNLCTVLLNNAISYGQPTKEEAPSIFASCTVRPALGKAFAHLVDLHLLMHRVPRTAGDARAVFGGQRVTSAVERVSVVEVLQDRSGGMVGRWAPFHVNGRGWLEDVT